MSHDAAVLGADANDLYAAFGIDQAWLERAMRLEEDLAPVMAAIDARRTRWQLKTIAAFHRAGVAQSDHLLSSGYGYDERARDQTEAVLASVFGAESALVRVGWSSGTHVLATMVRGLVAPGERVLVVTGRPYDTICPLFGLTSTPSPASLPAHGIAVDVVPLTPDSALDFDAIRAQLRPTTSLIYVQKSCGYAMRRALANAAFPALREAVGARVIAVDTCYCEYVEDETPLSQGADVIAGSLIKNPGAGLAPGGGYIAGSARHLERIAETMTAPGVGRHIGPQFGLARAVQQGLYFAPRVVAEALKSAVFAAALFADQGYLVSPAATDSRVDIVERVILGDEARLAAVCKAYQQAAPVDSHLTPVPAPMPGYDCAILMASGAFIAGSSIELSADGPLRPPYAAYLQGALAYENGKVAALKAVSALAQMTS